ncbi:MAG: energy transducer TonB [Acidithiobacillus sp.]|uniref:energy transducer TonB n=1 Tax=Acidithiobacillus sp. TaxID=1872118 RepID=UPI003D00E1F5
MSVTMSSPGMPRRGPKTQGYFGRGLIVAALVEAGLIFALVWVSNQKSPPPPPKPKRIAIHMVQPAPPKPKPKPVPPKPVVQPKPKPVPKPLPKPVPQPKPQPVIHHVPKPSPKPLVAKTPAPTAPVVPPSPPVTAPPPPPPPPAPSLSAQRTAMAEYASLVRARVQADTRVPEAVRLMHLRGTAIISFELTPSGRLVSARIAQSSGISAIDKAALAAVENTSYPPFTKDMPKHTTRFDVEVHLSAESGG